MTGVSIDIETQDSFDDEQKVADELNEMCQDDKLSCVNLDPDSIESWDVSDGTQRAVNRAKVLSEVKNALPSQGCSEFVVVGKDEEAVAIVRQNEKGEYKARMLEGNLRLEM